ncbi:serine hydrolase domain-containing protein [Chitinophaga niastensis]|uniref:serine hydrolase domain-containing protein n=1 Tax=Chitinophaga niastensis TaxID=536980 RepID=UPI001304EBDD|nr:serine hydrolase domain-containing protein [Chitinophaga niastensis]
MVAQDIQRKIDTLVTAYVNLNKFSGTVLVGYHGNVIIKKGYGFRDAENGELNNTNTVFQIGSITKEFTSAVILKLVEQKKLFLSDKLNRFYPDFPKGDSITIESLLTHTAGIHDSTRRQGFVSIAVMPANEQGMLDQLKCKPPEVSPDKTFIYSNSGYALLGYIIEKVTHKPYEQVVREMIFGPLNMRNSGFDFTGLKNINKARGYMAFSALEQKECPAIDSSELFAAGAMYSTVEDLYKWHQGLQSGLIMSKTMLNRAYIPFKGKYGYGWRIDSVYNKMTVGHSGGMLGFRAKMLRIPEDDLFIMLLSNRSDDPYLEAISRSILAIIYQQPYVLPEQPVRLSDKALRAYAGIYEFSHDSWVDIIFVDGHLIGHSPKKTLELFPRKQDLFYIMEREGEEGNIGFGRDEKGEVNEIYLIKGDNNRSVGRKIR